ncbi:AAA family ATPase [Halalkalibacter sp. APA_J-10(15)]|uniref:AAA family ATPase n=1 Tax=Halalkalibacter sp. APA_J-10(15) TaxID=2933805 RepID=UPI001FF0E057|nr:AAA family ATPase [Halalkalibacter sp. APA_J-10(15)]MCK0470962.1 AAA family ATPase [Halalkalibacter sp. APA_J-10(15)]
MQCIFIFGPQAVGKMTVGRELEKLTGYKLFHNHMTLELLHPFLGFGQETWRLSTLFRKEIFQAIVKEGQLKGIIFTFVWAFDQEEDWEFVNEVKSLFESYGSNVVFIELEADLKERLKRNRTSYRLQEKPTKRNVDISERELKESIVRHRLQSSAGEIKHEKYLKINNMHLSAKEVAVRIQQHFLK